jgi:phage shock protein E
MLPLSPKLSIVAFTLTPNMVLLKKLKFAIIDVLLGAILVYIYYAKVDCGRGSCAIASSPINSSLYGAVMGYLVTGMFKKEKKEEL